MIFQKAGKATKALVLGMAVSASMLTPVVASASPIQKIQDRIGTDRIAHFGAGYIIADFCGKTKMTTFEKGAVVVGVAALKEATDDKWDAKDFTATVLGGITNLSIHGKF